MPDSLAQPPAAAPTRPPLTLRAAAPRLLALFALGSAFAFDALLFLLTTGPWAGFRRRSLWLHRAAKIVLRTLNVSIHIEGDALPRTVSSPATISATSTSSSSPPPPPQVFLAKSEVRSWPVF
jgi:hypothetical protein